MCKNNSRESTYSDSFSPLQLSYNLIRLRSAPDNYRDGYYSYTKRWVLLENNTLY